MKLSFKKLARPKTGGCERRQCANDATYEVTWNDGIGLKVLCTSDKKRLEENTALLKSWFQIGPRAR